MLQLALALLFCLLPFASGAQESPGGKAWAQSGSGVHAEPWAFGKSTDRNLPIWAKGRPGKSLVPKENKSVQRDDETESAKRGVKSSLELDLQEESGTFKVTPSQKDVRPDEFRPRENKHIIGAYADVEPTEDFNIRVGPELILKDESRGEESAYSNQPDSALGLGMKFQYDF